MEFLEFCWRRCKVSGCRLLRAVQSPGASGTRLGVLGLLFRVVGFRVWALVFSAWAFGVEREVWDFGCSSWGEHPKPDILHPNVNP